MEALFLKILNLSLQASWIVLGVILFRLIFRKAPKYIRGILWAVAALRLVLPFSIESIVSLMPSKEVIPETIVYSPAPQINSGFESVDIIINPIITETFAPNPINSVNPLQIVNFVLACLWLIGIAVFLIYGAVNYILLYKRVSVSQNIGEGVYICDRIRTPFILGVIKPKIYLPSDIKETEKGYVIAHERAHLKRLDHIFKPLGFLILAMYWFNPIIWLGYVLFCRDMELACDEKVVKDLTAEEKKSYSETLLSFGLSDGIAKTFSPAFGEIGIRARIKTVLNYKKPAFWVILIALLLAAALAVGFLTDPISKNEETPDDTSSEATVETSQNDNIIPYTERWRYDLAVKVGAWNLETLATKQSKNDKNLEVYLFRGVKNEKEFICLVSNDKEKVVIKEFKEEFYPNKTYNDTLWLQDLDKDGVDEVILSNFFPRASDYDSAIYQIDKNGFREILNTNAIDYGYYLELRDDGRIYITNKYIREYSYFLYIPSYEEKYFFDSAGRPKDGYTLTYADVKNFACDDINNDGVFEIIVERYAVVKDYSVAIMTETVFNFDGEKFSVSNVNYSNYIKNKYGGKENTWEWMASVMLSSDLPAFEEGDTVSAESFLLWFRINELYDIENGMVTPYYQPYYENGSYKIPKAMVERNIYSNFAVKFSNEPTDYDDGDFYNLKTIATTLPMNAKLTLLEVKDNITTVNYKITHTRTFYDVLNSKEPDCVGTLELCIENDGDEEKIIYYRPNFYE